MLYNKTMKKVSLNFIAFLQAAAVVIYCGLVALLIWRANEVFGGGPNYFGPLLFLTLFVTSALVTGLMVLGYPIKLFWIENKKKEAIKLLVETALWLVLYVALSIVLFAVYKG